MKRLGEVIKELRRASRLSRDQLADQAGISVPFLTKIEQDQRRPSPHNLQRLAQALNVTPEDLTARAALLDASAAPTDDELYRRLMRAAALGGAATTAAATLLGPLGALVRPAVGLAAGTLFAEVARAVHRAQSRVAEDPASSIGEDGSTTVDPRDLREELISRINRISDQDLASFAALIQEAEKPLLNASPPSPHRNSPPGSK